MAVVITRMDALALVERAFELLRSRRMALLPLTDADRCFVYPYTYSNPSRKLRRASSSSNKGISAFVDELASLSWTRLTCMGYHGIGHRTHSRRLRRRGCDISGIESAECVTDVLDGVFVGSGGLQTLLVAAGTSRLTRASPFRVELWDTFCLQSKLRNREGPVT